ncbi:MAG: LexA family protein [Chitinophagaceae bacterium]
MAAAGIHKNNVLIVDRSIRPADGKIVVATIDGELLIRRVLLRNGKLMLTIDGDTQSWVAINEFQQITVWGIVTCIINMVEPALLQYANAAMK